MCIRASAISDSANGSVAIGVPPVLVIEAYALRCDSAFMSCLYRSRELRLQDHKMMYEIWFELSCGRARQPALYDLLVLPVLLVVDDLLHADLAPIAFKSGSYKPMGFIRQNIIARRYASLSKETLLCLSTEEEQS